MTKKCYNIGIYFDESMLNSEINVGKKIEGLWNDLSSFERAQMILNHRDHFLNSGLVSEMEIESALSCPASELEYWVGRRPGMVFEAIDLTETVDSQSLSTKMRTALKAVFFDWLQRRD